MLTPSEFILFDKMYSCPHPDFILSALLGHKARLLKALSQLYLISDAPRKKNLCPSFLSHVTRVKCQSYWKGILKLFSRPGEVRDISVVNVFFFFIFKRFNQQGIVLLEIFLKIMFWKFLSGVKSWNHEIIRVCLSEWFNICVLSVCANRMK